MISKASARLLSESIEKITANLSEIKDSVNNLIQLKAVMMARNSIKKSQKRTGRQKMGRGLRSFKSPTASKSRKLKNKNGTNTSSIQRHKSSKSQSSDLQDIKTMLTFSPKKTSSPIISEERELNTNVVPTKTLYIVAGDLGHGSLTAIPFQNIESAHLFVVKKDSILVSESAFEIKGEVPKFIYAVAAKSSQFDSWASCIDVCIDLSTASALALDLNTSGVGRTYSEVDDFFIYYAMQVYVDSLIV